MPFEFIRNNTIHDVIEIIPRIFEDERGWFLEEYKRTDFAEFGIIEDFVQDNHSFSQKGVLRGIHFQEEPFAQGKLVRAVTGRVLDVVVDLRASSSTYLKWIEIELSGANHRMLYIPQGFGHAFVVLSENTHFLYKCTAEYSSIHEKGIRYDSPEIGINWPDMELMLSPKDRALPRYNDLISGGDL